MVSLPLLSYHYRYLAPCLSPSVDLTPGRLCMVEKATLASALDATFQAQAGLDTSSPSSFSFMSLSQQGAYANTYLAYSSVITGLCTPQFAAPCGDVVLKASPTLTAATWTMPAFR